jgi:hypothetical protein
VVFTAVVVVLVLRGPEVVEIDDAEGVLEHAAIVSGMSTVRTASAARSLRRPLPTPEA